MQAGGLGNGIDAAGGRAVGANRAARSRNQFALQGIWHHFELPDGDVGGPVK
jgi:hypothetical protein